MLFVMVSSWKHRLIPNWLISKKSLLLVDPWDGIAKVYAKREHMGAYCTYLFRFDVFFLDTILARKGL